MARVEVITGPERRRRWSAEQKRAIVSAAFAPGAVVAEVARRAEVCPGQIYRWRRDLGRGVPGFAAVMVTPADPSGAASPEAAIEVEFAGARVRIPASIPPALAAAVVTALR